MRVVVEECTVAFVILKFVFLLVEFVVLILVAFELILIERD
jgi:hypothetical protein